MANTHEIWLPVPNYPNYLISSLGSVKSLRTNKLLHVYQEWGTSGGREVRKRVTVGLCSIKGRKNFKVHYLVLNTFKPCPVSGLSIDHIDRNPFNNSLTNLRWATQKQQSDNRTGIRKKVIIKITATDLETIYQRSKSELLNDIGKDYGITKSDLHKLLIYIHPLY